MQLILDLCIFKLGKFWGRKNPLNKHPGAYSGKYSIYINVVSDFNYQTDGTRVRIFTELSCRLLKFLWRFCTNTRPVGNGVIPTNKSVKSDSQ